MRSSASADPARPGKPDGQIVTEAPQLVVPSTRAQPNRAIGKVGVLIAYQIPDQLRGDLDLDVGHAEQR